MAVPALLRHAYARPATVRRADAVGSWLIGVAGRVARQMRKARLRRARHEQASGGACPRRPGPAPDAADLARIRDEEMTRLPDALRAPVVVCLLQGRTQEQAVAEVGRQRPDDPPPAGRGEATSGGRGMRCGTASPPRPFAARDRYAWRAADLGGRVLEVRVTGRDRAGNESAVLAEVTAGR